MGKLILKSTSDQLAVVKAVIDSGGDHHNLYKLVHNYLPQASQDLYHQVLSHFDHCAKNDDLKGSITRLSSQQHRIIVGNGVKLLSDMDDTLLCSGGLSQPCSAAASDASPAVSDASSAASDACFCRSFPSRLRQKVP